MFDIKVKDSIESLGSSMIFHCIGTEDSDLEE